VSTKQNLSDLFAKAGLKRGASTAHTIADGRRLKRELFCRAFAEAYVRNRFDAMAAYRDLRVKQQRHKKDTGWMWMRQRRVLAHIRELVQEATENVKDLVRLDVGELIAINEALIVGDVCDFVETATEWIPGPDPSDTKGGTYRTYNRLKIDPAQLTTEQRLFVRKITMHNGEVRSIEGVDRIEAIHTHVALLELFNARQGSNTTWLGAFKRRLEAAREARIDAAVKQGQVVRLPEAKKA
jgi:hypothetical protein